jgi:lipopolysaccharide transport system ATP-binding protein
MREHLEIAAGVEGDAIEFRGVTKTYRLYGSLREQALDILGIRMFLFRGWKLVDNALNGVDLKVRRGEQVGIVDRSEAGKTTLLKFLTGNFAPSTGTVIVNGTVQALMQTGPGLHPE